MNNLGQILGSVGIIAILLIILKEIFKKGGKDEAQSESSITNPDAPYVPSDKLQKHIESTIKQSTESAVESARKATESNLEQIKSTARRRDSKGRFIKSE